MFNVRFSIAAVASELMISPCVIFLIQDVCFKFSDSRFSVQDVLSEDLLNFFSSLPHRIFTICPTTSVSPPRSLLRGATDAATTVQRSSSTHVVDGSHPHSSGKTYAFHSGAPAPARHSAAHVNASRPTAARWPARQQSPRLHARAAPNNPISPAAEAPPQH